MRLRLLPLVLLLGCESGVPRLHDARSVTINYGSRDGQLPGFADNYRQLDVADAKEVQPLVDAFKVRRTSKASIKLAFPAMVDFHLADGSSVQCWFVEAEQLQCQHFQVYLRDRAFYDLVNKLVSNKEGRPIDVLKGQ
jgi:hypothetical protein